LRQYICYTVKKTGEIYGKIPEAVVASILLEKNYGGNLLCFTGLKFTAKNNNKKTHNVKKTCEIYGEKTSAWMPVFYCKNIL